MLRIRFTSVKAISKSYVGTSRLKNISHTIIDGKTMIHVSSKQFEKAEKKFEKLVVNFVCGRLEYNYVKDVVQKTWKLKNPF